MSAVSIVTQKLLASPKVAAFVGDRVFPILAPDKTQRPFIILHIIDNLDHPTLYGAGKYFMTTIQTDVYTDISEDGARQVIEIGDAVIEALNGTVKQQIAGCRDVDILMGSADFTEAALEANTCRRYMQFDVWWRSNSDVVDDEDESPALGEFSFEILAGSGAAIGYAGNPNMFAWTAFGELGAEPISGARLNACFRHSTYGSVVAFDGDISALVSGKNVWVDGVDYGPGTQHAWTAANGVTLWNTITGGPEFVAGETYAVEIK